MFSLSVIVLGWDLVFGSFGGMTLGHAHIEYIHRAGGAIYFGSEQVLTTDMVAAVVVQPLVRTRAMNYAGH